MIPNIYLNPEQIRRAWLDCDDSLDFPHSRRQDKAIAKAAADNAVKKVVEQFDGYKQLAGKRIYITAEHPDEWVELEEHELSVVVVIPIDDWQALKKLAELDKESKKG